MVVLFAGSGIVFTSVLFLQIHPISKVATHSKKNHFPAEKNNGKRKLNIIKCFMILTSISLSCDLMIRRFYGCDLQPVMNILSNFLPPRFTDHVMGMIRKFLIGRFRPVFLSNLFNNGGRG
jgi:hypothetical protein